MTVNRISLMEAYMLETLRSNGVSNEEILSQMGEGNVSSWKTLHTNFDFNELIGLAEQGQDKFTAVVKKGYQVKFITFKGLQRLLQLKFNKSEEADYRLTDKGVTDLRLDASQLSVLNQMLSRKQQLKTAFNGAEQSKLNWSDTNIPSIAVKKV